ncbi:Uncharacterised protein [Chlamydia trachomatis]|nr:Uncharacterised protein [Chlamydia trachomatis]
MATHDLDNEGALVRCCRGCQLVHRVQNAMECGIRTDCHVGAHHVIIDRADKTNNHQSRMLCCLFFTEHAFINKFANVLRPFASEFIRARKGAVATNNDKVVNTVFDQILRGRMPALVIAEFWTPGRTDDRAPLGKD